MSSCIDNITCPRCGGGAMREQDTDGEVYCHCPACGWPETSEDEEDENKKSNPYWVGNEKNFEIFFEDLITTAQERLLLFLGVSCPEEGNLDIVPIAVIPKSNSDSGGGDEDE